MLDFGICSAIAYFGNGEDRARLQIITNSHMGFSLKQKSMTSNDRE